MHDVDDTFHSTKLCCSEMPENGPKSMIKSQKDFSHRKIQSTSFHRFRISSSNSLPWDRKASVNSREKMNDIERFSVWETPRDLIHCFRLFSEDHKKTCTLSAINQKSIRSNN